VGKEVPVRTFADWGQPDPGYLEMDFVVHCGVSMAGSFIHTLVTTDVCSGWTEFVPLLAREQTLVAEGFEVLFDQIPFPVLGVDSDNDSAFINDTLLAFCREHHVEFTRSRAYHKNDQAWVEQKNGAVVRRLVGYERFSGVVAGQALAHLYHAARLYVNYFQPSFKLRGKERHGAKVKRTYEQPATPCERLLRHPSIDDEIKARLRSQQESPEITAKELFERLQFEYPGRFADGQLRTLQCRVRGWREVMTRTLVYTCIDERTEGEKSEVVSAGGVRLR